MTDDFGACVKGGAIFIGIISIIIVLVSIIILATGNSEAAANGFLAALITFLGYNVFSWISFGLYTWTKSQLEYNAGIFIAGTIFITAGGWWLFFLFWLIVVKVNLEVEYLIRRKKYVIG